MNRESSKRLYPYKEQNLPGSFSKEHAIQVVAICLVPFNSVIVVVENLKDVLRH
jgi:hypothetical protein